MHIYFGYILTTKRVCYMMWVTKAKGLKTLKTKGREQMKLTYAQAQNDAGLFRQWLAENYGSHFLFGGTHHMEQMARTAIRRLAKMSGNEPLLVRATAANDWLEADGEVAAGFRVWSTLSGIATCLATLPSIAEVADYLNQNPSLNRDFMYIEVMH